MLRGLLFPALCIHCQEQIEGRHKILCAMCQELLALIDPLGRCSHCFQLHEGEVCQERDSCLTQVAAAFDYQGPAASLVHQLKSAHAFYLAKSLASFMVIQLVRLNWPAPDLIVPVPIAFTHRLKRGYNQSFLLAKQIGQLLHKPSKELLKRSSDVFSQRGQDKTQRESLSQESFFWKKTPCGLAGKNLLLIDDVMTTKSTLNHCADLLSLASPKTIYALTTCLT